MIDAFHTAVGERNAVFAQEWLAREGIPLVGSDFGGAWARKVVFIPTTGDTYCRRIPMHSAKLKSALQEEARFDQAAGKLLQSPSVDLF